MLSRRRKRKLGRNFFLLFLLGMVLVLLWKFIPFPRFFNGAHASLTLLSASLSPTLTPVPTQVPQSQQLSSVIHKALDGAQGNYAVYVKNLATGETAEVNAHETFISASLYKLWVMAIVYQQLHVGKLTGDDVLSANASDLNQEFHIDADDADQTSGTITYSVNDALYQMITISDNEAALLLTHQIGLDSIAAFLKQNDLSESAVGFDGDDPTTTAFDVGKYLEELYEGKLGDPQSTEDMIALLKQQKLNEKIPLELPDDLDIAHKTGERINISHDAAIVYLPGSNYILVVLSQGDDNDTANQRIADISLAVYNYFAAQVPTMTPTPTDIPSPTPSDAP